MPFVFDAQGVRRLVESAKNFDRKPKNKVEAPELPDLPRVTGAVFLSTSTISGAVVSGSNLTAGSGTANRYGFDGTTLSPLSPTVSLTVYSTATSSIASGTWCQCYMMYGRFWVAAVGC
jgi:hypothetical protein